MSRGLITALHLVYSYALGTIVFILQEELRGVSQWLGADILPTPGVVQHKGIWGTAESSVLICGFPPLFTVRFMHILHKPQFSNQVQTLVSRHHLCANYGLNNSQFA